MGTDISGVVKSILQVKASIKTELSEKGADQGIPVSFMDLMNQNSLPNMNVSVNSNQMEIQTDTSDTSNTAYDAYLAPVKNVSVQESTNVTLEEMQEMAEEPLEVFEEEISKILAEELGVTEEEIMTAMENLGMSFLDLRNLQNLTTLVQELTGEDIGTLFASEAFQNVMEQVTTVTNTLCEELGITKEELNVLCETWKEMEQSNIPDAVESVPAEELPPVEELPSAEEFLPAEENSVLTNDTEKGTVLNTEENAIPKEETVAVQKDYAKPEEKSEKVMEKVPEKNSENTKTTEQITVEVQEEEDTDSGKQDLLDHSKNAKPDLTSEGTNFAAQGEQTVRTEEFVLTQETTQQPYANQVDAFDLIDQIAKNVRVTMMETATSMEMQLNPEHLGKIYLNVTEKEGIVRAHIATQNAVVKEALETQLVELRQSLNQQGIKVDAIEVTVSTHEFEQNLEENAKHQEQMQQQMEESKKQTRRNLNLNDLDGLTGLMSEEEQLAAQIMRDNGNQVDLTA